MKIKGTGFTYFYNEKQLSGFYEWEKYFKKAKSTATTEIKNLEVHLYE